MTKKVIDVKREHQELSYELSGSIGDVIAMMQRLKDETPEGSELILNYDTDYGQWPGDSDRNVVFMYDRRLETDEEYEARLTKENDDKEKRLKEKRDQLARLKKELGEE